MGFGFPIRQDYRIRLVTPSRTAADCLHDTRCFHEIHEHRREQAHRVIDARRLRRDLLVDVFGQALPQPVDQREESTDQRAYFERGIENLVGVQQHRLKCSMLADSALNDHRHLRSQLLVTQAELYGTPCTSSIGLSLFREAAELEEAVLSDLGQGAETIRGILAVSAASLWFRAELPQEADRVARQHEDSVPAMWRDMLVVWKTSYEA